jgi:hypothetical protein
LNTAMEWECGIWEQIKNQAIVLNNNYRYEVHRAIECPMWPSEPSWHARSPQRNLVGRGT